MADPMDSFTLLRFTKYADFELANASTEKLDQPEEETPKEGEAEQERLPEDEVTRLVERFKTQLADRVTDVRTTNRLVESPARLIDPEGTMNPEMQRVYKMLNREYEMPQKVLEINPNHAIMKRLSSFAGRRPAERAGRRTGLRRCFADRRAASRSSQHDLPYSTPAGSCP
jgi:molecular chaperone HtpG